MSAIDCHTSEYGRPVTNMPAVISKELVDRRGKWPLEARNNPIKLCGGRTLANHDMRERYGKCCLACPIGTVLMRDTHMV
jgi:hypothetical protein